MPKAYIIEKDTTLGTQELEQGMHPGRATDFVRIAMIAVVLLLTFNAGGLGRWTQNLPSNAATAAIAEAAAEWNDQMQTLGPAKVFDYLRDKFKIE